LIIENITLALHYQMETQQHKKRR